MGTPYTIVNNAALQIAYDALTGHVVPQKSLDWALRRINRALNDDASQITPGADAFLTPPHVPTSEVDTPRYGPGSKRRGSRFL